MQPDRPPLARAPRSGGGARILMFATDGHGSGGGISQYNVDVLAAMSSLPGIASVTVVPRLAPHPITDLPPRISYDLSGLGSIARYARAVMAHLWRGGYDAVWCGHINLIALAYLAARLRGVPLVLAVYGIDVWTPSRSRLANYLATRVDLVASISQVTLNRFLGWCRIPRSRTVILPNAITLANYGLGDRAPDLVAKYDLADRPVAMTFGRLVGQERAKGFDEMLAILPRLIEKRPSGSQW